MKMYVFTKTCVYKNIQSLKKKKHMEIIQMITTQWMDKENMIYPYKGLLFNNRKWNANKHYNTHTHTHTQNHYNTEEPPKHFVKWKQPDAKDSIAYDPTYMKISR